MAATFADWFYGRIHIAARLHPYDHDNPAVLLDYLCDVVDALAASKSSILRGKACQWTASASPVLIRLGLHALTLVPATSISALEVLDLILQQDLLYPDFDSARAEVDALLNFIYQSLTDAEQRKLWGAIETGPLRTGVVILSWTI